MFVEHFDGDWHPGRAAQQPVDDLQPALDPVSRVADFAERAGVALKRCRGHVVEHQRSIGQMSCRQGVFDGFFAVEHPVHRRVQVILIATGHRKQLAQGAGGGLGAQPARERQLGARIDHGRDQHRGHQIPSPRRARVDEFFDAQPPCAAQHRRDMPVRQAAGDLKRLGWIGRRWQALERPLQFLNFVLGPA